MSDTSRNQPDRHADRPEEVTDPLLWGLALGVADAHQPDEGGTACRNLLCAGQSWPCAAWNEAQRALRAAQTPRVTIGRTDDQQLTAGWPAAPVGARRLRSGAPDEADRSDAATSAA